MFLTTRVLSYLIKSWDNSQAEPRTIPRLNLGNIPAIARKTKLGQIPAIAGGKPCCSRDLSWEYISLLQLVMFPAIARYITRHPNAFITVHLKLINCTEKAYKIRTKKNGRTL